MPLKGMTIEWPSAVPKASSLKQHFVFVLSKKPVDLRWLEMTSPEEYMIARGDYRPHAARDDINPYYILRIPYELHWSIQEVDESQMQKVIPGSQLPAPEDMEEWSEISAELKNAANVEAKGMLGGIMRKLKAIPKCVWFVNQHNKEITVVVSQFSPNFNLSEVGINAAPTRGGFNFTRTVRGFLFVFSLTVLLEVFLLAGTLRANRC